MNKEQVALLRKLKERLNFRSEYYNSLPRGLHGWFTDCEYIESLEFAHDELVKVAFGEYFHTAVWFLYEWRPGFRINDAVFNTEEEFYSWCLV